MPARDAIVFPSSKSPDKDSSGKRKRDKARKGPSPELSRDAVFSFLKDTRGMVSWTARDLAKTLGVTLAQANDALPILEMQGYVKRTGKNEWLTTIAGESFSGSMTPRYRKEAVEGALEELRGRIRKLNSDRSTDVTVASAVAFGDFLSGRARVQAADVGIEIEPRGRKKALDQRAMLAVLAGLRAKSAMLHLHKFEKWMGERTHRGLI
jgi:hypothetical protein